MTERRDDTTKPETESPRARRPGSYYYDDATGYEIYKPEADEDEGSEEETVTTANNDDETGVHDSTQSARMRRPHDEQEG